MRVKRSTIVEVHAAFLPFNRLTKRCMEFRDDWACCMQKILEALVESVLVYVHQGV